MTIGVDAPPGVAVCALLKANINQHVRLTRV